MNILVLIKAVPNTSGGYEDNGQKSNFLIANPADLTALEEALKLRDQCGAQVTVATMGVPSCESILKQALACGADRAVLVTDPAFAGSDTAATSRILSKMVLTLGGFDLIFCGRRSTDGETGQVGPEIASRLGWNCVTSCTHLEYEENNLRCHCINELAEVQYGLELPTVISFCNGINSPRLASLSGLFRATRTQITVLDRHALGLDVSECGQVGSPTIVMKSYRRPFTKRIAKFCSASEGVEHILQALKEVHYE